MLGPLQLFAMSLPAGESSVGRVLAAIDRLTTHHAVRILDMLVVQKDADGTLVESSIGGDEDFGELMSGMLPVSGASRPRSGGVEEELWARAQGLPTGTAAVFVLVEHRWARGIAIALEEEGGAVLGSALLTPELGVVIGAEVAAMEDASRSMAQAQASEATARLTAIAAWADAEQSVAESTRIRSAAAADVLRTLAEAGLLEAAATDEAVETLTRAGLIVTAADEAVDRALQADATAIAEADRAALDILAEDAAAVAAAEARKAEVRVAASVTPAELRVLRYLPTRLTFALIADKLGISREAAKSRAERLYKRLGVHDRAAAVERARKLKVLP
jgi:DNA-binding NarL/FixJ family response regulator